MEASAKLVETEHPTSENPSYGNKSANMEIYVKFTPVYLLAEHNLTIHPSIHHNGVVNLVHVFSQDIGSKNKSIEKNPRSHDQMLDLTLFCLFLYLYSSLSLIWDTKKLIGQKGPVVTTPFKVIFAYAQGSG